MVRSCLEKDSRLYMFGNCNNNRIFQMNYVQVKRSLIFFLKHILT
uniref:Uncharacterized protein n=1 Tax=Lepeophtheirus salmonis TaxID=72036 RepID=A0A0K2UTC7_LEPSM